MMQLENKYLVLKIADIAQALTLYEQRILQRMSDCIGDYRAHQGKPENRYVVVNQDESYFPEVLKLMEDAERKKAGQP